MKQDEKWEFILELEDTLLKGGVILSEWTTFLAKDAELSFCSGANLSAIFSTLATIESHLRYESNHVPQSSSYTLYDLLNDSGLEHDLIEEIHKLRRLRNKWIHVKDPTDDYNLFADVEEINVDLEDNAKTAIECMLKVLYSGQWI